MAEIYVGVSGWRYASWRGDFYPPGLVQRRELEYVASRMTSVEMNGSFYSLQRPSTYRRMVEETPDDFPIAVKGGRYITHLKRLVDIEAPLANFFASGVLALGHQLGPMLWQLPPNLAFDEERVGDLADFRVRRVRRPSWPPFTTTRSPRGRARGDRDRDPGASRPGGPAPVVAHR